MNDISALFDAAQNDGNLSPEALASLNISDIGAQIQAGLGISADDVKAGEVVLVGILVDDSSSIEFGGNTKTIQDGVNMILDALGQSKQSDSVLVHVAYLNGKQFPFCSLKDAEKLNNGNYYPSGGTPLYDQTKVMLASMMAKTQEFSNVGVPVRSVTMIVTDGEDMHSNSSADSVQPIVRDMLMSESHIVGAMGIADGKTDFKKVFQKMGLDDKWILTPGNSQSDIRKAFNVFSQSAVRASQGATSFSKTAMGGFGSN